jgi:hypothetical protein
MNSGSGKFLWAGAIAFVLLAVLLAFAAVRLGRSVSEEASRQARRREVAAQLRLALASESEAEKSAVLAITDEDSKRFADEARAAAALAEEKRSELTQSIAADGTQREKDLLAQFSDAFAKFQRIDKELLDLAERNTNIKATALAYGPAAEAIKQMDAALSRVMEHNVTAPRILLLTAGAQAGALRIQALLPPHIAEQSDAKMDHLEAQMAEQDRNVAADLKQLARLVPGTGRDDVEVATASYSRFSELRAQILKLSRENTNVRSLAMSLNEKRAVMLVCQDALAELERALADEPVAGKSSHPVRPR